MKFLLQNCCLSHINGLEAFVSLQLTEPIFLGLCTNKKELAMSDEADEGAAEDINREQAASLYENEAEHGDDKGGSEADGDQVSALSLS